MNAMKIERFRAIAEQALAAGWEVSRTKGSHYLFKSPDPSTPLIFTSGTPGDIRSIKNLASTLRRSGLPIERSL